MRAEFGIDSSLRDELFVSPSLYDSTVLQHKYLVGVPHR